MYSSEDEIPPENGDDKGDTSPDKNGEDGKQPSKDQVSMQEAPNEPYAEVCTLKKNHQRYPV